MRQKYASDSIIRNSESPPHHAPAPHIHPSLASPHESPGPIGKKALPLHTPYSSALMWRAHACVRIARMLPSAMHALGHAPSSRRAPRPTTALQLGHLRLQPAHPQATCDMHSTTSTSRARRTSPYIAPARPPPPARRAHMQITPQDHTQRAAQSRRQTGSCRPRAHGGGGGALAPSARTTCTRNVRVHGGCAPLYPYVRRRHSPRPPLDVLGTRAERQTSSAV